MVRWNFSQWINHVDDIIEEVNCWKYVWFSKYRKKRLKILVRLCEQGSGYSEHGADEFVPDRKLLKLTLERINCILTIWAKYI